MTVTALNGLGRVGKLALNPLLERRTELAGINDVVGHVPMHTHLLEFDTVHGRWDASFAFDEQSLSVNGIRSRRPCSESG